MDQKRHQEYIDYYRARLSRYEGNPLYPRCAAAERALYEAISSAPTLEAFGERLRAEGLDLACAVAREQDVASAWVAVLQQRSEDVRIQPHLEVLRNLEQSPPGDVQALTGMVNEVHARWNQQIASDETLREEYWGDWKILEDIEADERAEVPERWREERQRAAATERQKGAAHWREHTLPRAREFDPEYTPDWEALMQPRHRRLFPLADAVVTRRIADHKRYVGEA